MFDRLLHEGKVAVVFLTRIPLAIERPVIGNDLARSAPFFPLVGAGLGLLAALAFAAAISVGLSPLIAASLAVLTLVLLTGALHEDGLADVADGLGGRGRTRRLAIMRDPRTGSFGVLALILSVLLRVGALAALADSGAVLAATIAAGALSRASMPVVMWRLPTARPDGLAAGAGRPSGPRALAGLMIGVLIAGIALGPGAATIAVLVGFAAAGAIGALAVRLIGGVTGDILGAAQQTSEIMVLLSVVALASGVV